MARRFLAPELPAPGERVTLSPEVSHHLLVVTLLPRGEEVLLFDGRGGECPARLVAQEQGRAVLEATGPRRAGAPGGERVLIAAMTRKPAWELVLRMGTELGLTGLRPFIGQRSVALGEHPDRWARILEGAAAQCGRGDLPTLHALAPLAAHLSAPLPARRLVLVPGAAPLPPSAPGQDLALLIGPEGGLTAEEIEQAMGQGFEAAGLGSLTLRADTAAVAALARYGSA